MMQSSYVLHVASCPIHLHLPPAAAPLRPICRYVTIGANHTFTRCYCVETYKNSYRYYMVGRGGDGDGDEDNGASSGSDIKRWQYVEIAKRVRTRTSERTNERKNSSIADVREMAMCQLGTRVRVGGDHSGHTLQKIRMSQVRGRRPCQIVLLRHVLLPPK